MWTVVEASLVVVQSVDWVVVRVAVVVERCCHCAMAAGGFAVVAADFPIVAVAFVDVEEGAVRVAGVFRSELDGWTRDSVSVVVAMHPGIVIVVLMVVG